MTTLPTKETLPNTTSTFKPTVLFTGDLHLHERSEFGPSSVDTINPHLADGLSILDQIIEQVKQYQIQRVIFLGDMCELKDRLPSSTQVLLAEKLSLIKKAGAHIIILMGNHDYRIKKFSHLGLLGYGLADVIDSVAVRRVGYDNVGFIPYYRQYADFKAAWLDLHSRGFDLKFVFFHQELPGISYKFPGTVPGEFDLPLQDGTVYFSGHIHQPVAGVGNRISYVGSPYQCHFGEAGESKFIWLTDMNGNIVPKELDYPKYYVRDFSVEFSKREVRGNYFKLTGSVPRTKLDAVADVKKTLMAYGARAVISEVKVQREIQKRSNLSTAEDTRTTVRKFVNTVSVSLLEGLDKNRLVSVGEQILEGVSS